ncbi:diguanylate cyclase [Sphingomonas sp. R86520]|uniref:ligand-binding sensor domain-containing protein n=1 Tax=Sphingomonas sp. R86520 TaxID=3093859 RepID=UPI0036D2D31C
MIRLASRGWFRPALIARRAFSGWLACGLLWSLASVPADAAERWTGLASTVFRNYGHDQGMPHPVATALVQGHDGFIWVGTQGGLARWDGYRFKAYKADPSAPGSLPDTWIQTLHVDLAGRLWVGTTSGRLARYDPVRDKFDPVRLDLKPGQIHVAAIVDDGAGGLWIGTDDGLRHLNANGRLVGVVHSGARGLPAGRAQAALRDRSGTLWVGTATGLARRTAEAAVFVPIPLGDGMRGVSALFEGEDGRLWIGTVRNGLFVIDRPNAAPRPIGANAHLPPSAVSAIRAAGPHEIWAALRSSGLVSVDTSTGSTTLIQHDRTVPTSLAHDDVWALLRDDAGSMWVGGTGGLSYRPRTSGLITTVFGAQQRPGAMSASDVVSILATHDGHVWIGYIDGGVDVIDPLRGKIAALRPSRASPDRSLPQETVFSMVEGPGGRVFIGTRRGLYVSNLAAQQVRLLAPKGRDPHNPVNALLYDAGVLWVGGEYDGIWGIVPGETVQATDRTVFTPLDTAKLTNPNVNLLLRGTHRDIWVGTRDGLNRIDLVTHRIEAIPSDQADPHALPAGFVSSLQFDRAGRLWVGTFGGGLAVTTGRDARGRLRFRRFGVADGLPHFNVDSLSLDGMGILWAGTDDGLARIDPNTMKIRAVRPADGGVLRDYFVGARGSTAAGEALFGAKDGFTIVRPGMPPAWRFRPRIVITDLRVGENSVPVGPYNDARMPAQLVLTPETNTLTVEFSALDFTAPEHNRFAYRLDGFDEHWTETDPSRRLAAYTNLPAGDYTLRLRGSNREGLWTERTLALRISVLPAWYQHLWFRLALVALLVLAILALVRWRTAHLRRRQRELERQIVERTIDLSAANDRLTQLAQSDVLTGCANRRHLLERANEMILLAARHDMSLSLAVLDLDNFKGINDVWGHPGGDAVLAAAGSLLQQHVRSTDILGRIGGEEFALLMPHTTAQGARLLADRVRQALSDTGVPVDAGEIRVTASFGIAELRAGEDYDGLYARADAALYAAKNMGRNRVEICVQTEFARIPESANDDGIPLQSVVSASQAYLSVEPLATVVLS